MAGKRAEGGVPIMAGIGSRARQTASPFATAAMRLMIRCHPRDALMRHA
jgi:hypothetical protein